MASVGVPIGTWSAKVELNQQMLEAAREASRSEVGTMPPCPFCKVPRVERSDYIRCNRCGTNWLLEESHLPNYLDRNPAAARSEARRMEIGTKTTVEEK